MCHCLEEVNNELSKRGIEINHNILGGPGPMAILETLWTRPRKRGERAPTIYATCCPFCGEKYPTKEPPCR